MLRKTRRIHFVGIGGIGMSGIAEVLINLGYQVTGSDLEEGATVKGLRALGGLITRAEMLAELMRIKYGIAIAGSHGKTTTTSMVAQVLSGAGLDPTIIIGGRIGVLGGNAKPGKGDLMVAEADESDGSFLRLTPTLAVVTNIDPEHLEHYGSLAKLQDSFVDFLNKVPFYGTGIVCLDEARVQEILPRLTRRVVTYGLTAQADLSAAAIELREFQAGFDVFLKREK